MTFSMSGVLISRVLVGPTQLGNKPKYGLKSTTGAWHSKSQEAAATVGPQSGTTVAALSGQLVNE